MKKLTLFSILFAGISSYCAAQISMYVRLTDYSDKVLTTSGNMEALTQGKENSIDAGNGQFIKISSFGNDVVQVLNIGSQSTGSGAGKITFNPFRITKSMDAASPVLFKNAASGTPFKTAEVFFANSQGNIISKQTYKLVAVKTVAWSAACPKECNEVIETVSFEYGGLIITVDKSQAGWNRVRNVMDSDLKTVIQ